MATEFEPVWGDARRPDEMASVTSAPTSSSSDGATECATCGASQPARSGGQSNSVEATATTNDAGVNPVSWVVERTGMDRRDIQIAVNGLEALAIVATLYFSVKGAT